MQIRCPLYALFLFWTIILGQNGPATKCNCDFDEINFSCLSINSSLIDDFISLGCFNSPSTFSFNAMNQSNVIAASDSMSWSLCARNCQFQKYRYAAVTTTQCFCSNTVNSADKVSDSLCSTNCAGDSSEKCGASSYQNVFDLSTVVGTICPSNVLAELGSLCCPERASFRFLDYTFFNLLTYLFPQSIDFSKFPTGNGKLTQTQLDIRAAYLNRQLSPNVWFTTQGSINISIVADGAGYRNQMGYFLIDSNTQLPIFNSFKDVFGDASWDSSPNKNPNTLKYKSCVPRLGLTSTIGPFPPGTGVGFFLHANGAGVDYLSDICRNNATLKNCLIQNGGRNYDCYRNNNCSIDAAQGSVKPGSTILYTWCSIDSLNFKDKVNNARHVALIETSYGIILGFEDMVDLGDQDYDDAMFLLSVSGEYNQSFPKLCEPSCNELNGKCNYNTGTCACNSVPGITQSSICDCQDACPSCTSGGVCKCSTKQCVCKEGFIDSVVGQNDCACSTVVGTCYGTNTNFNCGTCNCNNGFSFPTTGGPNTGIYLYNFGLSTTPIIGDYVIATGSVISGTSFGTFGWDTDHTSQIVQYSADGQPNNSIIKMKKNAAWTVYLQPNWAYDVAVTIGSQDVSTYNLKVIGSSTYTLASNLALGLNQYVDQTQRVTTGIDGKIVLQELNVADSATRLASVKISAAPCSCFSPPSGGCGTGSWNCYTGECECKPGYYGLNCEGCPWCLNGVCSQTGKCNCNTGWVQNSTNTSIDVDSCDTCASGFWACPNCGRGTCSDGMSGDGECTCDMRWINTNGSYCNSCEKGYFGSSCLACPSCPNGECSEGVLGTGKCNCNTGWIQGLTNTSTNVEKCDACALDYWGSDCKPCPNCGHGTCSDGMNGEGECTCHIGWINTDGSYCNSCAIGYYGSDCNSCAPGYYRNGLECIECGDNEYSFNETTCLPCPQNSERMLKWKSILDCNCTSFNHFPDNRTSTCLPCQYGYELNDSNICQKIKCLTATINGNEFLSAGVNEKSYFHCPSNYYVYQSISPYSPMPNEQGEAICLLSDDVTDWSVIKYCEPSCSERGGCDNNQVCAKPIGESIEKCVCAGYTGKYCENVDSQGCNTLNCLNNGTCVNKIGLEAAYCNCTGTGYEGSFCEKDINDCVAGVTCLNGGTCIDYGVGLTVCKCPFGFIGDKCELCPPNTCKNGGDCIAQNGISICNCFGTGHVGDRCEIQKEDCRKNGCEREGRCIPVSQNDTAICDCKNTGYYGNNCEISKNDCKTLPCVQGICIELENDTRSCSCLAGYYGSRCEIQKEDCRKNGCGMGKCITVSQNDTANCDCLGTGYKGDYCEISKSDCKTFTCLQGLCVELGSDTRKCSCLPGYEGARCEIQKEDCRKNGCEKGKCITISQNDTAICDCFGTGYGGDYCKSAMFGDCRTIEYSCLNNGECKIDYQNDSARCTCIDEFKGETCSMEKYSTVDQLTVYYFLAPILVIYLLICLGVFIQARKADKETKKSWIFFLLRILMSCLGIFDLLTDIFFVIQSYDYGVENNNFGFFWSSLIFTIIPWSFAALCTAMFLTTWKKKLDPNQNNYVVFSFFTVVSLLSANGVETFHLVTQYLFLKEGKQILVSDYAGYLTIYFIIKTFIEDFPQLIIQGIFQSELGKANAIVTLSLASSALSCFITAVTFPFTHEFEYIKNKFKGRDKENLGEGTKENLFQMQ